MPLPRVGLEERGTPMLDARTARILAKENEKGYEARWRREMVERCEKNIEKAVNEGRLHAVLFVGGLDDAKREALEVMRGRGFEIGEEVWREGLFKYRDVYTRDGEGRAYTQARASKWVPFFMMYMWIPVLLPMWYCGLLQCY